MDSFCDPTVRHITFVKSAQVGGSECMNNIMLYSLDCAPGPTLYVLPAQDDAAEEATGRIKRMMEQCERVQQYIPFEGFASSKRITLKGPRNIYMAWAKAHRTLIRRAIRYVWFDELDNLERAAGVHGDELQKAKERVTTFGHRGKTMTPTTPLIESGAGWKSWLESDRRTYRVPCPHCGAYQILAFAQIKWPEDVSSTEIRLRHLAWYECIECQQRIEESQRWWMVQRGFWSPSDLEPAECLDVNDPGAVAAAKWSDGKQWTPAVEGEAPVTDHRGYHIWSAYSPWRTFSLIAATFLGAKDNPERFRVFVNSWLGEPWSDIVDAVDEDDLRRKRDGSHPRDHVPKWVVKLTIGADTQKDHFYYVVRGWGVERRSALIREGVCESFEDLYRIAMSGYEHKSGSMMRPMYLAIDSGGATGSALQRTEEVYRFARTHPGVFPVKGQSGVDYNVRPSRIEYTPKGTLKKWSLMLYHVNVDYYKGMLYRLMRVADGDPGEWHVHNEVTDEFFKQVTAEELRWVTVTSRGRKERRQVWALRDLHRANHYLDAEVYGLAIADFKGLLNMAPPKSRPTPSVRQPPSSGHGSYRLKRSFREWRTR